MGGYLKAVSSFSQWHQVARASSVCFFSSLSLSLSVSLFHGAILPVVTPARRRCLRKWPGAAGDGWQLPPLEGSVFRFYGRQAGARLL